LVFLNGLKAKALNTTIITIQIITTRIPGQFFVVPPDIRKICLY
jgi:hypothetical protein